MRSGQMIIMTVGISPRAFVAALFAHVHLTSQHNNKS